MKKVVVVLPTYNEKSNLENTIDKVFQQEKFLPGWQIEVLVADSNSPDGTGEQAKNLALKNPKIHVISVGPGLGVGLIEGHKYSLEHLKPDLMAQLDADGQVSMEILPKLISAVEEGYDLALGSRFTPGGKNLLSPSRQIFSLGLSLVCRFIMGPRDIGEFANSARAFTPELFKKINLKRLPWREKSFIIQPAFLNEAILAGAKYKEVPLIFKNRAIGYSKNKIFNYGFDVLCYAIDARLHKLGVDFPFFHMAKKSKTIVKFGLVGFTGTIVDFIFYNLFILLIGLAPATAKGFSTEVAIVNNFLLNNAWTFRYRKTKTSIWLKFAIFNLVSFGGLAIGVLIIKFLHTIYGDGVANISGLNIQFYNLYFLATIPPVMIWNFAVNHFVTWRRQED